MSAFLVDASLPRATGDTIRGGYASTLPKSWSPLTIASRCWRAVISDVLVTRGRWTDVAHVCSLGARSRDKKILVVAPAGGRMTTMPDATAMTFVRRLRKATAGHFQIDTDGLGIYRSVIPLVFSYRQNHAQVVKVFGGATDGQARYSPARLIDMDVSVGSGNPDLDRASTSFVERHNRKFCMQIRRFTRLTDGHSKLWRNHEAAIALFAAYYNYCRVHMSLGCTPAMAAGLTDHAWNVQDLLAAIGVVT